MRFPHNHPPGSRAGTTLVNSRPQRLPAWKLGATAAPGFVLALALSLTGASTARAHDAPTGWKYPWSCCSGQDCRPVATKAISTAKSGYVIQNTGEVVPYSDTRIQSSPDGEYHWCSVAGADDGKTICLFVPQQMF